MEKQLQQSMLRQLLVDIQKRPGIICAANNEKKVDYLFYFLFGWLGNNVKGINGKFRAGIAHWIYEEIKKNKSEYDPNVEFTFLWYKMIYNVTETEEEAWSLFFKLSYEYLEQLETEESQNTDL